MIFDPQSLIVFLTVTAIREGRCSNYIAECGDAFFYMQIFKHVCKYYIKDIF